MALPKLLFISLPTEKINVKNLKALTPKVSHEFYKLTIVTAVAVSDKKALELRYTAFRNDYKSLSFGYHIMVDNYSKATLFAVVEDLRLYAVHAQLDRNINIVGIFVKNLFDTFFDD